MAEHGGIRSMAFSRDASRSPCRHHDVSNAFAGIGNPAIVLFDWATGKRKQLLVAKKRSRGPCGES